MINIIWLLQLLIHYVANVKLVVNPIKNKSSNSVYVCGINAVNIKFVINIFKN